jgi:hypothetical protein
MEEPWESLARRQHGLLARRQLNAMGIDADRVRNQLAARRWASRSRLVVSTFTGPLGWPERVWLGALHAGGTALVGGLTALEWHGLKGWHRDEVTVLVDDELAFDPVPGIRFFRTRRALPDWPSPHAVLPVCRVEPAALLYAGYDRSSRTAVGLLAAVVQQGLTTTDRLLLELERLRPLRRAKTFRSALADIGGGSQSLAEIDMARLCRRAGLSPPRRQQRRRDATGRLRFTDCEWDLADGTVLVLEIDGSFHMDVAHWEDDLVRQRRLSGRGRIIVRCTARELRDDPAGVLADLKMHGLCA